MVQLSVYQFWLPGAAFPLFWKRSAVAVAGCKHGGCKHGEGGHGRDSTYGRARPTDWGPHLQTGPYRALGNPAAVLLRLALYQAESW